MPLILQIRERVIAFNKAKQKYLSTIRQVAGEFVLGLDAHVGTFSSQHSILIGMVGNSGFIEMPLAEIGIEGRNFEFALCVTIGGMGSNDSAYAVFPISISVESSIYRFDLHDAGGFIEIPTATAFEGRFKALYDMIVDRFLQSHDPQYYSMD